VRWIVGGMMAMVLISAAALIAFFLGDSYAVQSFNVERATPTQLGNAMQADTFYSSYRNATVLFSGSVVSVSHKSGSQTLNLMTGSAYAVQCRMQQPDRFLHAGVRAVLISEGGSAQRESHGVLLTGCVVP
jgi:hypothetical protein